MSGKPGQAQDVAQTAGIYYNFTATFPQNFDGEIGVTQLVDASTQSTAASSSSGGDPLAVINTNGNYELDRCVQNASPVNGTGAATLNLDTSTLAYDAPGDPLLAQYASVTASEAFDTYYMYKPNLPNSIG